MYILTNWWSTPDNDGYEIVGLFYHLENAQDLMKEEASKIRAEYPVTKWEDDFCWQDDMSIHMGFDPKEPFAQATIYSWDITKMEADDDQ